MLGDCDSAPDDVRGPGVHDGDRTGLHLYKSTLLFEAAPARARSFGDSAVAAEGAGDGHQKRPLTWTNNQFNGRSERVEVLRRYSNRPDLLKPLVSGLERIEAGDLADMPGIRSVVNPSGTRSPIRDRLTLDDIQQLVARFHGGTAKRVLAEDYRISLSSVQRLLRKSRDEKR